MQQSGFKIVAIGLCSLLFAFSINTFLMPFHLVTGGLAGFAILLNHFIPLNTGWIVLLANIPLLVLGYFHLGRKFICLTVYSVLIYTVGLRYLPIHPITHDLLISAIFGGVLIGFSIGMIIRLGGSLGGIDIISLVVSLKTKFQVGFLNTCINILVVVCSAFVFGWDKIFYTIIAIYISGKATDNIYTSNNKLTVSIVTDKWEELREGLLRLHVRGITLIDAEGGFSHQHKKVLTSVITKYQLLETKQKIQEIDPKAFVSITRTEEVMGRFRK